MHFTVDIYRRAAEMELSLRAMFRDPTDAEIEAADAVYREACSHVPNSAGEINEKARLVLIVEGDTLEPAVMSALISIRNGAGRMKLGM